MRRNEIQRRSHLRYEQAAGYLGVSIATLRRWVRAGRLTPVRILGKPRFAREALDAARLPQNDVPEQVGGGSVPACGDGQP